MTGLKFQKTSPNKLVFLLLVFLLPLFLTLVPRSQSAGSPAPCVDPLSLISSSPQAGSRIKWTESTKARALQIMLAGSLNVSRTVVSARRFAVPGTVLTSDIPEIATRRFKVAAQHILNNHESLQINQQTAIELNRLILKDLAPTKFLGDLSAREKSPTLDSSDCFIGYERGVKNFYKWLQSSDARTILEKDPVLLAELIHYNISTLDAFIDGNGRTARLMADLVLIRSGLAPAYYTDIKDYFARGAVRATVSREELRAYFREIVARGQKAMKSTKSPSAQLPRETPPDPM